MLGKTVRRFDHTNLIPWVPGYRFNSSLIRWQGRYLMAFRNGWRGSEVFIAELTDDLNPTGYCRPLQLTHPAAHYGREDPRLFVHQDKLHVAYIGVVGRTVASKTNQLYAELDQNLRVSTIYYPRYRARRPWEKNWAWFSHDGVLYASYCISPHRVLKVTGEEVEVVHETETPSRWNFGEMRGGASPVLADDKWWHFFHGRKDFGGKLRYATGLLCFENNPPFRVLDITHRPIQVADPLTNVDNYADVVFPCGAVHNVDHWLVSSGVHDRFTQIDRFETERLAAYLSPTVMEPCGSEA